MPNKSIMDLLESGERARLIPVTSARQKELAAVSVVLAVFRIVPDYARIMLEEVGAPWSQRSKLTALTEICFKKPKQKRSQLPRPDGMLIIDTSRKEWVALVEAKIKNEELKPAQLEGYLDLAKEFGIDALITISNQFATIPSHHPVAVDRRKLKSVDIYHFSWLSLLSNAQLLSESETVKDREQAIVLKELIRFLSHHESGVQPFDRMGQQWKDICAKVQNAETLAKSDPIVEQSISDWSQLTRYLALTLSARIGKRVHIVLGRKQKKSAEAKYNEYLETLIKRYRLANDFSIPNTAGDIHFEADLRRRTITISMALDPPKDKKRPTAAINWLTRQLRKHELSNVLITCQWPRKTPATTINLKQAIEFPDDLVPENIRDLPTKLEVRRVVDLAGRFRGAKTMVEDCEKEFVDFYRRIGQHLTPWTPPPPKYRKPANEEDDEAGQPDNAATLPERDDT